MSVASLVLAIAAACALSAPANASDTAGALEVSYTDGVLAYARSEGTDRRGELIEEMMGEAGGWRTVQGSRLPPWFLSEVAAPDSEARAYVFDEGTVVGFIESRPKEEVWSQWRRELEARGWCLMETGATGSVTGVREGGGVRWLSISCTQVSDETCVVVQVPSHP